MTYSQVVLDVSKYRVRLEKAKKQLHHSEKQLQEIQRDFNEVSSQMATIEKVRQSNDLIICMCKIFLSLEY